MTFLVLAYVFKSGGCAVEAVGYNHAVFDDKRSYLPAAAVGVFRPYSGHAQIAAVKGFLLDIHSNRKISENSRKRVTFAVMKINRQTKGLHTPVMKLTDVGMTFGNKKVLDGISLTFDRGDFVAMTGPNGGGKTTLLRIILKLLAPTAGKVEYLDAQGVENPRLTIGYLPQKTSVDSRFPITVRDVVRLGLMGSGCRREEEKRRVTAMLEQLGLEEKASSPIGMISGGQLQRTLLGRALISEPEVIVLDEPLSYLDKYFEHKLYDMLREVKEQRPLTTVLLVSHEMSEIAAMATRHIIIDHGLHICHSASHLVHYDCEC